MDIVNKQISDLRLGKETALGFLMDRFGHALHIFAFKYIRDKQTALEIVSDAFVKLWERRQHFETIQPIKSFLYVVVRNACLDHLKESRRKYRHEGTDLLEMEDTDQDIIRKIIYTEFLEMVISEIKNLPRQQAKVIQLSMIEGRDIQEVCEELGTTANAVYFAKSKAIATLRRILLQKKVSFHYLVVLLFAHVPLLFV